MKYKSVFFLIVIILYSCNQPKARRPKKHGTQNFYKEVLKENKKINNLQKKRIEFWLSKDTLHDFVETTKGYWYYYVKKDTLQKTTPKLDEVVDIEYDIKDMLGGVIYKNQKRSYKIDKEDFIPALQDGIKLMKIGETITFVIPSYRAYGITGDGNKIGVNQPIQSTVTLIDIKNK